MLSFSTSVPILSTHSRSLHTRQLTPNSFRSRQPRIQPTRLPPSSSTMPPTRPISTARTKPGTVHIGQLLSACVDAARRSCDVIRQVQRAREQGDNIGESYKDVSDPRSALTIADEMAQSAILRPLMRDFAGLTIVAEEDVENGDYMNDSSAPLDINLCALSTPVELQNVPMDDVCVFCDPVDATLEFVKGRLDAVQTLIGISVRGRAIAGAIGRPFVEGDVVYGMVGAGVVNLAESAAVREAKSGMVVAASRSSRNPVMADVMRVVDASEVLPLGGAGNKMMQVAMGKADVCVLNLITSLWDTAATEAVIVACGGKVTDLFGNRIQHSATARICNRYGVLVSGPNVKRHDVHERSHEDLCKRLRESMVLDTLLADTGLVSNGEAQATNIALDLDGNPITSKWLSSMIGHEVESFSAPERTAVRYLMSDACRLHVKYAGSVGPKSVFMKRVVMAELEHVKLKAATAPLKLARDVTSYQVETSFLGSDACRRLKSLGTSIGKPYFADSRPAGEGAAAVESKFLLLLEDFSPEDGWRQFGLLDEGQVDAAVDALSTLHGFFWDYGQSEDYADIVKCVWDQATYWAPKRQAADSFEKIERCWQRHLQSFSREFEQIGRVGQVSVDNFGRVLAQHATAAAERVHGVGLDETHAQRTLIHGDAKGANFFFKELDDGWDVGVIDLQWCGWGHCATDIAYVIATSANEAVLLEEGCEERILRRYYEGLLNKLVRFGKVSDIEQARHAMEWEDFNDVYEDSLVDLARVVVSYHWERIGANAQVLKSRRDNIGSNSYNKNVQCALWLVKRVMRILSRQ